jgi:two-component system sensor histidine kinase UhpB
LLRVTDDGTGIERPLRGGGIRGMRERALMIGGRLTVDGNAGGTSVTLRLPRPEVIGE